MTQEKKILVCLKVNLGKITYDFMKFQRKRHEGETPSCGKEGKREDYVTVYLFYKRDTRKEHSYAFAFLT
jgi:hypothetical protein